MTELQNLQASFQHYLFDESQGIKQHIKSSEKASADMRLDIYHNAYRVRLMDALLTHYPILASYVGEDIFDALANDYIRAHPSTFRSIRWFGDQLMYFLHSHEDYKAYPCLSELAQFEWAMSVAFDAEDKALLNANRLKSLPPESWVNMHFEMHPSVARLNFSWNVVSIWQSISEDEAPSDPMQTPLPMPWLIWRKETVNQFCSLTDYEAWAIDAVLERASFGEIGAGLCQWFDEEVASVEAASLLKSWIEAGLLTDITIEESMK